MTQMLGKRPSSPAPIRSSCVVLLLALTGTAYAEQVVWTFDDVRRLGAFQVQVEGDPHRIDSPMGPALEFDGHRDSLLVDGRPLVGAACFTIEVLIRPEGGEFEQRFLHIAQTDAATGLDAPPAGSVDQNARLMFELRVVDSSWYLDAFMKSSGGGKALALKDKLHPLGRWYAVAQSYDGKTYRTYVDGVLEGEADTPFVPHGPGRVRVGARMNQVSYFKGAIAEARFTDRALSPRQLLRIPHKGVHPDKRS